MAIRISPDALRRTLCALPLVFIFLASALQAADVDQLYQDHCAQCHNPQRLGGMGPALLPGNLKRLRKPAAIEVISKGRVATQMPAFADKLDSSQIESLVEYIYTPSTETLAWGLAEINASHIQHNRAEDLPAGYTTTTRNPAKNP